VWLLQYGSFVDLSLVAAPVPGQFANRRAFVFALFATVAFYGAAIGLLALLLSMRGISSWDSTVLHFPTELVVFLLDTTLPPLACAFVLVRSYHFPYMLVPLAQAAPAHTANSKMLPPPRPPPLVRLWNVLLAYVRCLLLGDYPTYSDISMIYLCKVYLFAFSVVAFLLLSCVQARYFTFVLPQLLLVRFDVEGEWTYRFSLLTLQLMTLVLLAVNTVMMRLWPSADLSVAHYDKLYSLALLKHEARRGTNTRSEEVISKLEEETEALIKRGYRGGDDDD